MVDTPRSFKSRLQRRRVERLQTVVTVTETRERERARTGLTEIKGLTTQAGPEGKTAQELAVAEVETAAMAGSTMETGRKGRTGQEEVALVMMARAALETEVAEKDSPEMAVQVTEVTALKDLGAAMAMAMGETQVPEILEPALTTETVPGMALATTDLDLEGVEATMEIQEVAVAVAVAVAVVMMEARIIKATRTGAMEEVTQAVMEAVTEEAGREAMGVAA